MSQNIPAETTLKDSIETFMQGVAKHAPPEVLTGLGAEIKKLAESGIARRALQVGAKAPDFTLPDVHGKPVTLSALLARGPAVVTFYRGGWCPFCDLQLRAYQGALGAIHDLGAEAAPELKASADALAVRLDRLKPLVQRVAQRADDRRRAAEQESQCHDECNRARDECARRCVTLGGCDACEASKARCGRKCDQATP